LVWVPIAAGFIALVLTYAYRTGASHFPVAHHHCVETHSVPVMRPAPYGDVSCHERDRRSTPDFRQCLAGGKRRDVKGVCSAADAETLEPRRRSGHQFYSASWQLKVGRQQAGDGVVGLAVDRWLADVDCQLTVGTDLDEGPLAAAGLNLDDDGVGHVAEGYRPKVALPSVPRSYSVCLLI
jgi:hypothetical protein